MHAIVQRAIYMIWQLYAAWQQTKYRFCVLPPVGSVSSLKIMTRLREWGPLLRYA